MNQLWGGNRSSLHQPVVNYSCITARHAVFYSSNGLDLKNKHSVTNLQCISYSVFFISSAENNSKSKSYLRFQNGSFCYCSRQDSILNNSPWLPSREKSRTRTHAHTQWIPAGAHPDPLRFQIISLTRLGMRDTVRRSCLICIRRAQPGPNRLLHFILCNRQTMRKQNDDICSEKLLFPTH